jgi:hypothetical protein
MKEEAKGLPVPASPPLGGGHRDSGNSSLKKEVKPNNLSLKHSAVRCGDGPSPELKSWIDNCIAPLLARELSRTNDTNRKLTTPRNFVTQFPSLPADSKTNSGEK